MAVVNLNLRHQSENLLVLSHAVDIRDTGRGEKVRVSCAYTEHGERRTVIDRAKLSLL